MIFDFGARFGSLHERVRADASFEVTEQRRIEALEKDLAEARRAK
jgi:hypothetical protein